MSVLRVVFFTPGLISLRALIQLDLFTWETAPPPHPLFSTRPRSKKSPAGMKAEGIFPCV